MRFRVHDTDQDISSYSKSDIHQFLNEIPGHRTCNYCFNVLKNVFIGAEEDGIIRRNPIANLKIPKGKTVKGKWYNPGEQRLIYENRHTTTIGDEIEFLFLVGCRISEASNVILELSKNRVYVERTKRDESSGYVRISSKYAEYLKLHWPNMFNKPYHQYAQEFVKLLTNLKTKRQENEKPLHRLRHSFGTNIYYLGANDKLRSEMMGHKKTEITNDIYTDFDADITKKDILDLWGDLYPKF